MLAGWLFGWLAARESERVGPLLHLCTSSCLDLRVSFLSVGAFLWVGRSRHSSFGSNMSGFKISEKQYTDANQTFQLFDKKGNGTVSTKELGNVFKSLGLQVDDDKLKEWADAVDEEAQGCIDWEQFKPLFELKLHEDEDEREMREAFRVLDKNNKGVIPVDDLRWLLKSLGDDLTDDEIESMINETDTDGSGTVDYDEFRNLMNSD